MTRVKALAIAVVVTVTFLSAGLGISAHFSRSGTANAGGGVTQTDALSLPADQTAPPRTIQVARTAKHDDDDEHDRDAVKTTRSATEDRGHDHEEEDD